MTPEKKDILFHIFYFNSKGSYQIGSIFDMYLNIHEKVYICKPRWAQSDDLSPPPPPHYPPPPPRASI